MANETARALRKAMTPQEVKLWAHLRPLRSRGFKFRRQVPLRGYIVDFACFRPRLIIEAYGAQHGYAEQVKRDSVRDTVLSRGGFAILRFWNSDIDREFDGVWTTIVGALQNAELRDRWTEDFGEVVVGPE